MRIVVFANDVVPGMSSPVAAPGLRAWGIAAGLRDHGHEVTTVLDDRVVPRVWHRAVPLAVPPHTVALHPRDLQRYAESHDADALVITNSNPIDWLSEDLRPKLVYDFFAPKILEFEQHAESLDDERAARERQVLVRRKLAGLRRADAVIVNGAKKQDYVAEWLARAGVPDMPRTVVNMALPTTAQAAPKEGPLQVVASGYLQPWSKPGAWVSALRPMLDDGSAILHLMVAQHWGSVDGVDVPAAFRELTEHPSTVTHGLLDFREFRRLLSRCDLSVDVFERNPERELAMVTRSMVALSCGLPVMHVPFTEVGPIIDRYGAGWLVDEGDTAGMRSILEELAADRALLEPARAGAAALAREVIEPKAATAGFTALLEEICA
jgi:glycosyltransferase involved in cell wall biosynthesis